MTAHYADPDDTARTLCGRAWKTRVGLVGYDPPCMVCERVTRERARIARIAARTPNEPSPRSNEKESP